MSGSGRALGLWSWSRWSRAGVLIVGPRQRPLLYTNNAQLSTRIIHHPNSNPLNRKKDKQPDSAAYRDISPHRRSTIVHRCFLFTSSFYSGSLFLLTKLPCLFVSLFHTEINYSQQYDECVYRQPV